MVRDARPKRQRITPVGGARGERDSSKSNGCEDTPVVFLDAEDKAKAAVRAGRR